MSKQVDVRDRIAPPFWRCPSCGQEAFGVLAIRGTSYTRRCRACWLGKEYPLWPVRKKVIYIDQFAISNMMKAITTTAESRSKDDSERWHRLFERLDRASKAQLIVCPSSNVHRDESLMAPYFEQLKRMYDHLSHGISFHRTTEILDRQINQALLLWMSDQRLSWCPDRDPNRVTNGELHEWQGRVFVTVDVTYSSEHVRAIRERRESIHDRARAVFEFFAASGETNFAKCVAREQREYAESIWSGYEQNPHGPGTGQFIIQILTLSGRNRAQAQAEARQFVDSDAFNHTPANYVSTLLWSVIAREAALGSRTTPPDRGTVNDIDFISTLLPYCDAMLLDKRMAGIWTQIPQTHRPRYRTQIFRVQEIDKFFGYLDQVEKEADPAVLRSLPTVFGEDWATPFVKMYERSSPEQD